jgi:hypothetical protein
MKKRRYSPQKFYLYHMRGIIESGKKNGRGMGKTDEKSSEYT